MPTNDITLEHRRVLIVEDDYFIAAEVARAFELRGAQVVGPAPTIATAFDLVARDGGIELAVLDINLRGEMVYPLAEALQSKGVPFVFATGYDAAAIPPRFRHVPLLTKPTDAGDIVVGLMRASQAEVAVPVPVPNRFSFRVMRGTEGWTWEVLDHDGERIASGASETSEAARAEVYCALVRDQTDRH